MDKPVGHIGPGTETERERFWAKVSKQPDNGCWLWTAGTNKRFYGVFGVGGKARLAHRISFTWTYGPIPEGLVIDHYVCSNSRCVNPLHLRAVTPQENLGRELRQNPDRCITTGCTNTARSEKIHYCNPCYRKELRKNEKRQCKITGCGGKWYTQNLCAKHYYAAKNAGTLEQKQIKTFSSIEGAQSRCKVDAETGCWIWNGPLQNGYGKIEFFDSDRKRKSMPAHRAIWELHRGQIPEGRVLDHFYCANKLCCNPDHLEVVTLAENSARSGRERKGVAGSNPRKTMEAQLTEFITINPSTDCHVWTGPTNDHASPIVYFYSDDGKLRQKSVRRHLIVRAAGVDPASRIINMTCNDFLCVNPKHAKVAVKVAKPKLPKRRFRRRWRHW